MAKKKNNRKQKQALSRAGGSEDALMGRRRLLGLAAFGALGTGAAAAGGWAGLGLIARHEAEHDLGQIGRGKPAVVQVHDPKCPTCTALQRQTRRAMRQFGECDLLYLVADINLPEGQIFARRHNVGNVTLVLLDGQGEVVQVLAGLRQKAELEPLLSAHVEAFGIGA